VDDSGLPRTPDRLLESFGTRARRSEVFGTMMCACGPLNSGGSATLIMDYLGLKDLSRDFQSYYVISLFFIYI